MAFSFGKHLYFAGEITIGESGNKGDFLPILLYLTLSLTICALWSFLSFVPLAAPANSDSSGLTASSLGFFTGFALKFHLTHGVFHPRSLSFIYLCIKAASQQKHRPG